MLLPSGSLLRLKNLFAFRDRLIKTQASLKQTIRDLKDTNHLIDNKFIIKQSEKQLKLIEQQVRQTEEQIEETIQQDQQIQKHFRLLCSIPGIGLVTAVALILATNNFTGRRCAAFTDGRKFASYCGVAPFESGLEGILPEVVLGERPRPANWLTNILKPYLVMALLRLYNLMKS